MKYKFRHGLNEKNDRKIIIFWEMSRKNQDSQLIDRREINNLCRYTCAPILSLLQINDNPNGTNYIFKTRIPFHLSVTADKELTAFLFILSLYF